MSTHTGFGPQDRWRLRQNRLWILAAILFGATVVSFVGIIHDTKPRYVAARLVRRATAERLASYAESRLTVRALETFGECRCADTLPARERFTFDRRTSTFTRSTSGAIPDAVLIDLARAEAKRGGVHLSTSRTLGTFAVVTHSRRDTVFGLVARAADIGALLFSAADSATDIAEGNERMVTLDSMSVLAIGPDSVRLFGTIDPDGRYYQPTPLRGALEGSTIAIALPSWQINRALMQLVSSRQLWHNGLLILATAVVAIFAIGSSRREMLLVRARSDFVAGVSHELRMPLAQILLAGETLVAHEEMPRRERTGLANTILRESRRLIGLVENLLLFSRTGSVELRPRIETVRVADLFASVVESVELAADDADQTIDVSAAPSIGVRGDSQLLRQALVNLVDNALKYGAPGQRVRLTAERDVNTVRMTVEDQGPGIPERDRDRVFEPYERLGRDQTSERTGTGLGLSVVRQIVLACGGRVWLESGTDGRGTRAVIELSAADVALPVPVETL